ncbi:MAG: insulinase family protein [Bacteroidetes bacterium]|nr:insulinase family protein [Bacteroidota bacterium]
MDLLNIEYEKYNLKNGLEVVLFRDSSLPLVASNIWYKVGSANERKGKTGIAHLFEHMMFQGSKNVPKEMHFKYIQEAGGSLNGSTSFDRTNYYEKVPSNFLELILWLESDRMGYFIPALTQEKLDNQISVVRNERLERYDNQPYGLAWELIISNLYQNGHPYSWPTIGFLQDITSYTIEDVTEFFKTYYSPSNACLVIAGDFDNSKTKELIEKYFGNISTDKKVNHLKNYRPYLNENVFLSREDNVQLERIYLTWHSEKAYGEYDAALDILSDILSGSKSSRLYKNLVFEKEVAQDVTAYQFSGKLSGFFTIIATAKPGVKLDLLKEEILKELNKLKSDGVTEKELIKSKNGIKSSFIYSMQNIDSLADQINSYNFFLNEPNSFNFDLKRFEEVENDKLKSTVEKYFSKPFVELQIIPQSGDEIKKANNL